MVPRRFDDSWQGHVFLSRLYWAGGGTEDDAHRFYGVQIEIIAWFLASGAVLAALTKTEPRDGVVVGVKILPMSIQS